MRKLFTTVATMALALVMCLSTLFGCGLVTTDNERDMQQVVATVQIEAGAPQDKILKRDMVMAYLNYGYMYEQYYGYTREQTFTEIINSLVNNRIYVQTAIKEIKGEGGSWELDLEQYLNTVNPDANREAKYSTYKAINDLIKSYRESEQNKASEKVDTIWGEVRTTPTNAANEQKEVTDAEKDTYIEKGIIVEDSADFRNAYNKVIELLRTNELLGDKYDGKDITKSIYFEQTLKNYQESELIAATEKKIKDNARNNFSFDDLKNAYKDKLTNQQQWTNAEFVEKLSSASASDPVLFGYGENYGYVYNLLLGADDVLKGEISSIKTDLKNDNLTKIEYAQARANILKATSIVDLRSSWITSGYDFDGTYFKGDYTFAENVSSLQFFGDVTKIKDVETDGIYARYRVDALDQLNLVAGSQNYFIDLMEKYVYGDGQAVTATLADQTDGTNPSEFRRINCQDDIAEYENKINELLFAFSTDAGSLNTYKGYVIKPKPDGADSEEYMQEFADGARELIKMGGSSYIMVATDYGYHVMFFSEVFKADYTKADLETYLNELYTLEADKTWQDKYDEMLADWDEFEDTENYLYLLTNSLTSTAVSSAVSKYQTQTLDTYRYAGSAVKLYQDRYADLLK